MNCPLCVEVHLDVTYHGGIEVDVCPRCRGIWLDRGELERLAGDRPLSAPLPGEQHRSHTPGPMGDGRSRKGRDERPRSRRLADRLGDVLEEVLDL